MITIKKYVMTEREATFDVPYGARVLCVHDQNNNPTIWMLLDTDEPMVQRLFKVIQTGESVPESCILPWTSYEPWASYVGTVHQKSGLVWHIFDVTEHIIPQYKDKTA